jgi:hypothetical protein
VTAAKQTELPAADTVEPAQAVHVLAAAAEYVLLEHDVQTDASDTADTVPARQATQGVATAAASGSRM